MQLSQFFKNVLLKYIKTSYILLNHNNYVENWQKICQKPEYKFPDLESKE